MGKAIKCPSCNSFYNGAVYHSCPYCREGGTGVKAETVEKKEKGGIMSLFTKEKKQEQPPLVKRELDKVATEDVKYTRSLWSTMEENEPEIPAKNSLPEKEASIQADERGPQPNEHKAESAESNVTLSQAISRSGRTVGKYFSTGSGENIAPVVGWIVGVKGSCRGQSFQLKSGRNKVGRSHEMDVKLLNDESVSRTSAAVIIFDAKAQEFSIVPGESDSLCYVNNRAVYDRQMLYGYESIEFGDAGLNQYVFVPFCGDKFSWSDHCEK